jgi:hypothetical protein
VTPDGTNYLWTTPRESEKIYEHFLDFNLLMRASFCLVDCGLCHSSLCLLVSGSYSKTRLPSPFVGCVFVNAGTCLQSRCLAATGRIPLQTDRQQGHLISLPLIFFSK